MNSVLQNKLNELQNARDYECWYLVKQPTNFAHLCYLVSFLKDFVEHKGVSKNLEAHIGKKVSEINALKPELKISNNYRALRVAAFFGLIKMTSSNYSECCFTDTYNEINSRCNGAFENINLYQDIITRQIEKMFISSSIDEGKNSVRKEYSIFPIMFLDKILIEIGKVTGNYSISMNEYRYFVATTKKFDDYLDTMLNIKLLREECNDHYGNSTVLGEFERLKDKFDNRMNKAIELLDYIDCSNDKITLLKDKIEEVAQKVYDFEKASYDMSDKQYVDFLCSTNSLFDKNNKSYGFNVYGMHITRQNSSLDKDNSHICIGWSYLGDLSNIQTKDELSNLYSTINPNDSNQRKGANVSQIWMFKDEIKVNDYIVYFDKGIAHIGKVVGDYEYIQDTPNQDSDYVNNRKVEWVKDIAYKDLPSEYRKSSLIRKSLFRLSSYKPLVQDIISGNEIYMDEFDCVEDETINKQDLLESFDFTKSEITDGQNLIVYGTPGCGKSYYVEHTLLEGYSTENYIRTTFFQDYTNTDFVGQILPVVEGEKVTYKFNPGPFTLALEQAIKKPNEKIALVIEELNRGSAASIFGDIFQLLDRKNGVSEYSINNVNIINYLKEKFEGKYTFDSIKLPGNLSIYATMNTSDQNVFTLDTAFKRRWKFKKLLNKFETDHKFKGKYIPGANITWKDFVDGINKYILESSSGLNSEDKQLGVYFVDDKGMRDKISDISESQAIEDFAYKVLEYLWADVAKFDRSGWFDKEIKSLDDLVAEYKERGIEVFNDDIFKQ